MLRYRLLKCAQQIHCCVIPIQGGRYTCLSILPEMVTVPFTGITTLCATADFTTHNLHLERSTL